MGRRDGFTLLEMLVSTVILLMILGLVFSLTDQTSKVWKKTTAQIQTFEGARAAYTTMTTRLRQATLNTTLDYYAAGSPPYLRTAANASTFIPSYYARASDLHFVVDQAVNLVPGAANLHPTHAVFFQAPLGFTTAATAANLPSLLNACGYYIEFNTDAPYFPNFVTTVQERYRYRLMEFLQPSESFSLYRSGYASTGTPAQYDTWFTNFLPPTVSVANAPVRMLAENIIALVILPELSPRDASATSLAPNYTYDSRAGDITTVSHHQLPPLLRVVMVAIDETSAQRLNPNGSTTPPSAVTGLLSNATPLFSNSQNLDADLSTLSTTLTANKVTFRVFDTDIAIHGARWSNL